jgi:PIN domain nuclease of toxin-antitoxin system
MANGYCRRERNQLLGSCDACVARAHRSLPVAVETWRADLLQAGVREISIDGRIALLATSFHDLHRDPADRFIVATAMHHSALLVTADSKILEWQADLASQDARD